MNEIVKYKRQIKALQPIRKISSPSFDQVLEQAETMPFQAWQYLPALHPEQSELIFLLEGEIELRQEGKVIDVVSAESDVAKQALNSQRGLTKLKALTHGVALKIERDALQKILSQPAESTSAESIENETKSSLNEKRSWIDQISVKLRDDERVKHEMEASLTDEEFDKLSVEEQITEIDRRISLLKEILSDEFLLSDPSLNTQLDDVAPEEENTQALLVDASKRLNEFDEIAGYESTEQANSHIDQQGEEEITLLKDQLGHAKQALEEEREKLVDEHKTSERQKDEIRLMNEELQAIKNKLRERESYELKRDKEFQKQLDSEKKRFRKQMKKTASGFDQRTTSQLDIELIKQTVALETQGIVEKLKLAHEEYRQRQDQKIQIVKTKLQQQSALIINKARQAEADKASALVALQDARQQLLRLKEQQISQQQDDLNAVTEVPLLLDVEAMEEFEPQSSKQVDEWFDAPEDESSDQELRARRIRKMAHDALEEALDGNKAMAGNLRSILASSYK